MSLHTGSTWILYDLHCDRIGNDAAEVSRLSRYLVNGPYCRENYRGCDLERSARNLRDAADKLDAIRDRLGVAELSLEDIVCMASR